MVLSRALVAVDENVYDSINSQHEMVLVDDSGVKGSGRSAFSQEVLYLKMFILLNKITLSFFNQKPTTR